MLSRGLSHQARSQKLVSRTSADVPDSAGTSVLVFFGFAAVIKPNQCQAQKGAGADDH